MPHEDKKKKTSQSNQPQPNMSESSSRPHLSDAVMNEVRVNVQNPVDSSLRQQTQTTKEEEKRSKTKQKTPSGFAVRGFPVDPSLYHLIDEETFGPSEAVLDLERSNVLYSTNANEILKRNGLRGNITDKRQALKMQLEVELTSKYGDLGKLQALDIVKNNSNENKVEGNVLSRMLAELHGSTYDGASETEIRAMFYGALAGYDSNNEEEKKNAMEKDLEAINEEKNEIVEERQKLTDNEEITEEERAKRSAALDRAQKALDSKRTLWQKFEYKSDEEKINEAIEEINKAEELLTKERGDFIKDNNNNNNIMDEMLDAYDSAQEALAFKRAFYQKQLTPEQLANQKRIKIKQGLVAQKQIYYRHLKRVTAKYGKYLTQMNVFDFMSVNPADQVGSDLGFLQDANFLIRYYPEIVDMRVKEDREYIAMLHFVQTMQSNVTSHNTIFMNAASRNPSFSTAVSNDSSSFGTNLKQISTVLTRGQETLSSASQDLSLAGDLLESSGVPMRGLSKKEGKSYMKSAQKRGVLQNGEKEALESIGKGPDLGALAQQCRADLNTIQQTIEKNPIPGETGKIIGTFCTLAGQFFKGERINLSQLQTVCWELMKRCDVMFGPEYESLYGTDWKSMSDSQKFNDLLEPFLIKLQIILQYQKNLESQLALLGLR